MYLTQGLHRVVQQRPGEIGTVCAGRVRTHAESADRIARLAAAFRGLGLRDGDRAAILSANSDRFHESAAATLWAGGVVVPVNCRWSVAEIAESLAEVDARILVADDAFAGLAGAIRAGHGRLAHVVHSGDGPTPEGQHAFEELVAGHEPIEDARRGGDQLAGVFFTGGTTGRSKGVMLSHGNLLTSAMGWLATEDFSPGGILVYASPMFHLAAFTTWVFSGVLGWTQVMTAAYDPLTAAAAVQEYQATDLTLVTTMIQMIVDHPRIGEFDLSSVRRVMYGASPMSDALIARAMTALPNARFIQGYGMTELAPAATVLRPADHEDSARRKSVGRAAPHCEVRIVDAADAELPRGEVGEIVVRGGNLMLGYWNRPEESAEVLRNGWMHTGDVGWMDDEGYLFLTDRLKDMIISGGENVYSVEVENCLAAHPAVAACAVIGVPDDTWGERVHAVVVPVAGAAVSLEDLRSFCARRIAGYKAPRSMEVVDALPLSAIGKVLKRELRRPYWEKQERAIH
ncbi:fatty-acid--CoA ligase [Amycolatopsis sp. AA4]|uniref:long-chain-fatty-acid--CoA ligase n=1 Tax=Actinomycetes TaxID=1760 RepID=UPI0001B54AEC|nr:MULTISPECIES: long-chain-fatty-acid--CoA ligase [Actinomycetes]ATY12056.1 fatty-acid--CoA ligase [Amycolatopsis sp. AA4]